MAWTSFKAFMPKIFSPRNLTFVTIATVFVLALLVSTPDIGRISNYISYTKISIPEKKYLTFVENTTRIKSMELYNKSGFVGYKQFFDYIENPVTSFCKNETNIGGKWYQPRKMVRFDNNNMELNKKNGWYIDGNKIVCIDEEIFGNRNECLVLSIGIDHDWTFDDAIIKFGCRVFAFDHTIGQGIHTRNRNIHFYPYGAGKENKKIKQGKLITVASMMDIIKQKLGTNVTTLTYLKLDIEGAEVDVFEYLLNIEPSLLDKFQQIGMEIHPGKINDFNNPNSLYKKYFQYFMTLEKRGFVLFHSTMNPVPFNVYFLPELNRFVNGYYELVWGNWR